MKLKKGDKLPQCELFYLDENKTVKKINTNLLFKNQKAIIFGVPGAFTAVCSLKHLPGFVKNPYDYMYNECLRKTAPLPLF